MPANTITPTMVNTLVAWTEYGPDRAAFTHRLPEARELGYVHDAALRAANRGYVQTLHAALQSLIPSRPIVVGGTTYPSTDRLHAVHIRLDEGQLPVIECIVIHTYGTGQEAHATYTLSLPQAMQTAFTTWAQNCHGAGYAKFGLTPPT